MFKYFQLFLVLSLLLFAGCVKENEVNKPVQTIDGQGIILNKEQGKIELPTATITGTEQIDQNVYQGQTIVRQKMTIAAEEADLDKIEVGDMILSKDANGRTIPMLIYEADIPAPNRTGRFILKIDGVQVPPDLYYKDAIDGPTIITPANRTKGNVTFASKVEGEATTEFPILDERTLKFGNSEAKFTSDRDALLKFGVETKIWEEGKSFIKTSGSFAIQPALDFQVRYEAKLVKKRGVEVDFKRDDAWNYFKSVFKGSPPDVVVKIYERQEYKRGDLQHVKANLYLDIDMNLGLEMHFEKEIKQQKIIPIGTIIIPKGVVHIELAVALELDLTVEGQLDLNITHQELYDFAAGFHYDRYQKESSEKYKPFEHFSSESKSEFDLKAKVVLRPGITLVLSPKIYFASLVGVELEGRGYLNADIGVAAQIGNSEDNRNSIDWSLKANAGLTGSGSLNLKAFGIDFLGAELYKFELDPPYEKLIYEAPKYVGLVSGGGQSGVAEQPLPQDLVFGAYDSRLKLIKYLPVTIYLQPEQGSVNPTKVITEITKGTKAVQWTLGPNAGLQVLNAWLVDPRDDQQYANIEIKVPTAPGNQKPTAPTLTAPANAATSIALNTPLKWEAGSDPDGDPLNYTVLLGTTNPPTDTATQNLSGLSYTPTGQANNTKYYWQVIVSDGKSDTASAIRSYTTLAGRNNPPTAPALTSPTDAATNIALNTKLAWQKSTDTDGDNLTYDVYLDENNPPTTKVVDSKNVLEFTPQRAK